MSGSQEQMSQSVEPDACFYIQNQGAVIGKKRLDLRIDPPPDLVIEIDITSRTQLTNYQVLGVPELWRYDYQGLQINVLQNGEYIKVNSSPIFPEIPIIDLVNQYIEQSQFVGTSQSLRAFRIWSKENLSFS